MSTSKGWNELRTGCEIVSAKCLRAIGILMMSVVTVEPATAGTTTVSNTYYSSGTITVPANTAITFTGKGQDGGTSDYVSSWSLSSSSTFAVQVEFYSYGGTQNATATIALPATVPGQGSAVTGQFCWPDVSSGEYYVKAGCWTFPTSASSGSNLYDRTYTQMYRHSDNGANGSAFGVVTADYLVQYNTPNYSQAAYSGANASAQLNGTTKTYNGGVSGAAATPSSSVVNSGSATTATLTIPNGAYVQVSYTSLAPIIANSDSFTIASVGGTTNSVLSNDTFSGAAVSANDVTVAWNGAALTGLTINADGTIAAATDKAPGTYTVPYKVCEKSYTSNCATATASVNLAAGSVSNRVYNSGSVIIPSGVSIVTLSGLGGSGTQQYNPGQAEIQQSWTGQLSNANTWGPQGFPSAISVSGQIVPSYVPAYISAQSGTFFADFLSGSGREDGFVTTEYRITTSGSQFENVYGTKVLTYQGYVAYTPYQAPIAPYYYNQTTGSSSTATLAGATYTYAGGYGGAATPTGQAVSIPNTGHTLSYSIASGGYLDYSYTFGATIGANGDDFAVPPAGGTTASVFANDLLSGAAPTSSTATINWNGTPVDGFTLGANGAIVVASGLTPGIHSLAYKICETSKPSNCSTAVALVRVLSQILANSDTYTATTKGGSTASVFENDQFAGAVPTPTTVTVSRVGVAVDGFEIMADGSIKVSLDTPPGNYSLPYKICENAYATNCATAQAVVNVLPPIPVPTNVVASDGLYVQRVDVTWDGIGSGAKYWVYRDGIQISEAGGVLATNFSDTTTTGFKAHSYTVVAGADNRLSEASIGDIGFALADGSTINLVASDGTVTGASRLNWSQVQWSDGYRVFRNGDLVATISNGSTTTYLDIGVAGSAVTQNYSVLAFKATSDSSKSDDTGYANVPPSSLVGSIVTPLNTTSDPYTPGINDANGAKDSFTFIVATQPVHGTAALVDNQVVYTPNNGYQGQDSFNVTATDRGGAQVTGNVSVLIDCPRPVIQGLNVSDDLRYITGLALVEACSAPTQIGVRVQALAGGKSFLDVSTPLVSVEGAAKYYSFSADITALADGTYSFSSGFTDAYSHAASASKQISIDWNAPATPKFTNKGTPILTGGTTVDSLGNIGTK